MAVRNLLTHSHPFMDENAVLFYEEENLLLYYSVSCVFPCPEVLVYISIFQFVFTGLNIFRNYF